MLSPSSFSIDVFDKKQPAVADGRADKLRLKGSQIARQFLRWCRTLSASKTAKNECISHVLLAP
jgi:hypothetical protein